MQKEFLGHIKFLYTTQIKSEINNAIKSRLIDNLFKQNLSLNVIKNIVSAEKLLKQADLMRYCQIKNISINEDEKINKPKLKQPIEKISALDVKTEQHLDQLLRGFNHLRIIRLDIRASNFWWSKTNIWPKVNLIFQLYLLKQKYPEKILLKSRKCKEYAWIIVI